MITREEAQRRLFLHNKKLMDEIYESVGFCSKCKNYSIRDGYCRLLQREGISKNFVCVDFERESK